MESLQTWWETNPITRLYFSGEIMQQALPIVAKAFPLSLLLGAGSFFLAMPLGLALAFMKMSRKRVARWPATFYVDIVRGTPLFLQILIVFFGLPLMPFYSDIVRANPWMKEPFFLGMDFTLYFRAFFVLSFNSAAYMAEIFRAGIQSIPKGQTEAARSLGMNIVQSMTFVIIPQTIRRILPTMMSEFILLFKDTALLAAVSIPEMTQKSREVAASTFNMSSYMLAAGFYLLVTIPLGRFVAALEDKLAESEGGGGARPNQRNAGTTGKRSPLVPSRVDSEHIIAHRESVLDVGE